MQELEKKVKKYLEERSWDGLKPGDLAKSVSIEAGELLEIFQWDNPALDEVKKDAERLEKIKKELADVLIYCLEMSVLLELDTEKIIKDKLAYIEKKYPAEVFKTTDKDKQNAQEVYWKIKKEHRRKGIKNNELGIMNEKIPGREMMREPMNISCEYDRIFSGGDTMEAMDEWRNYLRTIEKAEFVLLKIDLSGEKDRDKFVSLANWMKAFRQGGTSKLDTAEYPYKKQRRIAMIRCTTEQKSWAANAFSSDVEWEEAN